MATYKPKTVVVTSEQHGKITLILRDQAGIWSREKELTSEECLSLVIALSKYIRPKA